MSEFVGPCWFVIFGATGNLARIKLLPALYHLEVADRLNDDLRFLAYARRPWEVAQWRAYVIDTLREQLGHRFDAANAERFAARFGFVEGDLEDPEGYLRLREALAEPRMGSCENVVFYLAIPPSAYVGVVEQLDRARLAGGFSPHRIVVEKPFGSDLASAGALNARLHEHFGEDQIYRIDHYLGKETVQNLLVFRFANSLIEPVWNRNYVDHVQITVAEAVGLEGRAGYFEGIGTLRDMLQNHLLQLMAVTAMEPPAVLDADALRDEKVKVLRSIRPIDAGAVDGYAVRAQYGAANGARGYLEEDGVRPDSRTETYVAAKFYVDNWRWRGVPFYLRTGKRMARKHSAVALRFRQPPQLLFHDTACEEVGANWISLAIQPVETMQVALHAKRPGLDMTPRLVTLDTSYRLADEEPLDAYETLLLDVVRGDGSLFIRFDEVELAWAVVAPILDAWQADRASMATYPAGSWGPPEADRILDRPVHAWRNDG